MRRPRRRRDVSFHRARTEAFRLDTEDVEEGMSLWERLFRREGRRRDGFSRYIAAGGTRDTREDARIAPVVRSWRRFAWAFAALASIWILGACL